MQGWKARTIKVTISRDAEAIGLHLNTDFDARPEAGNLSAGVNDQRCLQVAMADLSHIALLENALYVVSVRVIGLPEIFGQRHQDSG